jgi:hypothetical protein
MRVIYLSKLAQPMVNPDKTKLPTAALSPILASLNRFVEGGRINVSLPSKGGGRGDLKGLRGYGKKLFMLRFSDAAPQYRLLGAFVAKDQFVGIDLSKREVLDGSWDRHCRRIMNQTENWSQLGVELLTYEDMDSVLSKWVYAK